MMDAPSPNQSAPSSTSPTPVPDASLDQLMAPGSAYWNREHPGHTDAVRAVQARYERQSGDPFLEAFAPKAAVTRDEPTNPTLERLTKSAAYLDGNHPDHKRIVAEVTRMMFDSRDNAEMLEADRATLRSQMNIDHVEKQLPHGVVVTAPEDEVTFLHFASDEGLSQSQVHQLYREAATYEVGNKVITPETIATFVREMQDYHGIDPEVTRTLVRWYTGQ